VVTLGDYFGKRPVILTLNYFECPMLCTEVLNGLVSALGVMNFSIGKEFDVVTVSFDPRDTPERARQKKAAYLGRYKRPGSESGWHFLTGSDHEIAALTRAVGFRYAYNAKAGQFAHASGVMVATPEGRLSHYFYGIEYGPRDLRLALVEASNHKIGTAVDQVLLACFHYDPSSGRYSMAVMTAVRAAGTGDGWVDCGSHRSDAAPGAEGAPPAQRARLKRARLDRSDLTRAHASFHPLVPRAGVHDGGTRGQPVLLHGGHQRVLRRAGHAAGDRFRNPVPPPLADGVGEPIHGSLALELIWTGIPFVLAMVMFVWGASVYFALARMPDEALDIYAVGKQWMWKFQHREGQREINELHVPVNTPVRVI
jgi:cytochrome oxidase Cu insertion factor (SCO1/SenC/PrrC family)